MSAIEDLSRRYDSALRAVDSLIPDDVLDDQRYAMTPAERARVRRAEDYERDLVDYFANPPELTGAVLPWGKTHSKIRIRAGELSIWAGVNGHGKSMLLSHVMLHAIRGGGAVCVASLEMRPLATLGRMARQAIGGSDPAPSAVRAFLGRVAGALWIYDQQRTVQSDRVLALARYAREYLGVDHLVIDSLMKCGIGTDDYNRQKAFVDQISTYAHDSGLHVHLVAHSRKGDSEDRPMDKFDIKGTSEITDLADNVFTLWRNKPKESKRARGQLDDDGEATNPDAILVCDKQRHGSWEGRVNLWFEPQSLQYLGKHAARPIDYMRDDP